MLSSHTLLIAAIFIPYMALMVTLGAYMWGQVRHHLDDPGNTVIHHSAEDDEPPDSAGEDGPELLIAA